MVDCIKKRTIYGDNQLTTRTRTCITREVGMDLQELILFAQTFAQGVAFNNSDFEKLKVSPSNVTKREINISSLCGLPVYIDKYIPDGFIGIKTQNGYKYIEFNQPKAE
jgi:hypothetical protein